jgi:hypothetical protein
VGPWASVGRGPGLDSGDLAHTLASGVSSLLGFIMIADVIDSYYLFVQQQMAAIGAQAYVNGVTVPQPFAGVVFARDWPLTEIAESALHLVIISANAVGGSVNQTIYEFVCQWNWLLIGTNLTYGQVGANRGDRYRTNLQIMNNLRQAHYPGFCQKQSITGVNQNTQALTQTPSSSTVPYASNPYNTVESIWWTKLRFPFKQDQQSGVVYGVGAFSLYGIDSALASLAA